MRLEYGSSEIVDCTAAKTTKQPEAMEILASYFIVEGVGLRLCNHSLRETYESHIYSCNYFGKTIHMMYSIALMDFYQDYYNICRWAERHKYSWNGAETDWSGMAPADGLYPLQTSGRECSTSTWCIPNSQGVADCTGLIWDYGGVCPGVIINSKVDASMIE